MQAIKWVLAVAIFVVSPALFAAESNDVVVSHYEPLQRLSIRSASKNGDTSGQKIQQATPVVMSFDALGRTFDLQLEPNAGMLPAESRDALLDGVNVYRGALVNRPGSWARIVVYKGVPRGLFWDGNEMFAIEAPGDSQLATDSPVVYRLADTLVTPGAMTCGTDSLSGNGAAAYSQLVGELDMVAAQALGAVSEITMAAIGDSGFTTDAGGDADARLAITNRFNSIDGIFSEQVSVQIRVESIDTFDAANDPFTNTDDARILLDELSAYRLATPAQNSRGLTHLYTGRNIDTSTVGIAWRGGICSDYFGAGLSQGSSGNPTLDILIAAHEIGHNFNAEHDGSTDPGTSCPSEPDNVYIMAPSVTGLDQFSDCSITVMETWAASQSCVTAIPAVDVSIGLDGSLSTVLLGAETVLTYDVSSNGLTPVSSVEADIMLPNNLTFESVTTTAGTCMSSAGTVNCVLGDIPGITTRTIAITTTPTSVGPGTLSATVVTTDVDERPSNNQSAVLVTVAPAVDLVVNTPTSAAVVVNAMTTVNAVLENRSIIDATGVALSISLSNGLQANSASWSLGTCTVTQQQVDCLATDFAAQSNTTLAMEVRGISAGSKSLTVTLSSVEAEANPADNSIDGAVRVNSPGGDDEGGGSTGPAFLGLLLLIATLARRLPRLRQK